MFFPAENRKHALNGLVFVILFAVSAVYLSELAPVRNLGLSPLIVGIVLGMIYGNTLRKEMPGKWVPGIVFSTKNLLKIGVVLYGFRLTFTDIAAVGMAGFSFSAIIVVTTFVLGSWMGVRLFGLDIETAMLTAVGSSVCGAAAVLATEPVLKSRPYKSAMAVSTVVLFGTLTMFLYPLLFKAGFLSMDDATYGLYVGGTIHEVAHAVAAGNAVSPEAGANAVIVKMIRVMLLAPLLIAVSMVISRIRPAKEGGGKIAIPWFAVLFIVVVAINSLGIIPRPVVDFWNALDLFILTMAMCALGMETDFRRFRGAGPRPFYLAGILFLWVTCGGYLIAKAMVQIFP